MKTARFRAATAALGLLAMSVGSAGAKEIIYGSHVPDTHPTNAVTMKGIFDEIREKTGGASDVKIVGGGALAGAAQQLEAVKSGAIDATILIYNYTPSELPVHTFLADLFTTNPRVAGPAMSETILLGCPECQAEQDALGVKILMNTASMPYTFECKGAPIVKADDVAGKKYRSTGSMAQLISALGGTAVNISFSETYEALQRGQVDCTIMSYDALKGVQLWDVVKYVTKTSLGTFNSYGSLAVNGSVWDSLTAAQKRVWLDASANGLAHDLSYFEGFIAEIAAVAEKEHGLEFVEPDQSLVDAVAKHRASEVPKQIELAKSRGVKDPQAILDYYEKAIAKWTGIVNSIGPDGEWSDEQTGKYADAIKREIYSKVAVE